MIKQASMTPILESPLFSKQADLTYSSLPFNLDEDRGFHEHICRRRAEVAYLLINPKKEVFIVRKRMYPEGVFRIPTGGVKHGETPLQAITRELVEETGMTMSPSAYALKIEYTLSWPGSTKTFATHLFVFHTADQNPVIIDKDKEHDTHKFVGPSELPQIFEILKRVQGPWNHWAVFRSILHDRIVEHAMWDL